MSSESLVVARVTTADMEVVGRRGDDWRRYGLPTVPLPGRCVVLVRAAVIGRRRHHLVRGQGGVMPACRCRHTWGGLHWAIGDAAVAAKVEKDASKLAAAISQPLRATIAQCNGLDTLCMTDFNRGRTPFFLDAANVEERP